MNNPLHTSRHIQTPGDARVIQNTMRPVLIVLAGALSSSMLGGVLAYDGTTEEALAFAVALATAFFLAGAACSLLPAMAFRRKMASGKNANLMGFVLFSLFCIPVLTAILLTVVAVVVVTTGLTFGNR